MTGINPKALTAQQWFVLWALNEYGPEGWITGAKRTGGARSRLLDRLATAKLVKGPPFVLTPKGVTALWDNAARIAPGHFGKS